VAAIGIGGISVRQTTKLLFRASLKGADGTRLTTGTTNLYLYEIQDDGSLKSYDWNDNTFKTGTLTTEVATATHQTGNNGATSTGLWTKVLATLTGFTVGAVYVVVVENAAASPPQQEREFQFGSVEGDPLAIFDAVVTAASGASFTGSSGLSGTDDFYKGSFLAFTTGTLKGIARKISGYTGATKTFVFTGSAGTLDSTFPATPSAADRFVVLARGG
jgi:hypothetical protein